MKILTFSPNESYVKFPKILQKNCNIFSVETIYKKQCCTLVHFKITRKKSFSFTLISEHVSIKNSVQVTWYGCLHFFSFLDYKKKGLCPTLKNYSSGKLSFQVVIRSLLVALPSLRRSHLQNDRNLTTNLTRRILQQPYFNFRIITILEWILEPFHCFIIFIIFANIPTICFRGDGGKKYRF